jgi:SOS response regulatory protein OraA/RecX
MRKITYVKSGPAEGSLFVGIQSDGEREKLYISQTEYVRCGSPERGEEIDEDTYMRMARFDEYHKAKKKALSILAYGDNNQKNLIRKLRIAGFAPDLAALITREMVAYGYIDERDQLKRLILAEANDKLQGPNKIFAKLTAKGYESSDIRDVMQSLVEAGEINFKSNAYSLIEKKLPSSATSDEKKTLLYKNGYKI